ncbi:MAG TPA: hypothetical protein VK633_13720, partial [Verrucomicrobiae bacterium]|nr:hypothetical protein [Verrucomicrobiae bacterium]
MTVTAIYELSGTALNGIDYSELSGSVTILAGREAAEVIIRPVPDKAIEGEETVFLKLQPSVCAAIFPPPPECYLIGQPESARAIIRDSGAPGTEP